MNVAGEAPGVSLTATVACVFAASHRTVLVLAVIVVSCGFSTLHRFGQRVNAALDGSVQTAPCCFAKLATP